MANRMQQRRGNASDWTSANPILLEGEIGLELDTYNYKIGDGVTAWNSLSYKALQSILQGLTVESDDIEPSTPIAGHLQLYGRAVAGRNMLKFKGSSGIDSYLQPAIFGNGMYFVSPGTSTTPTFQGGPALSAAGTVSHPVLNGTNLVTQARRFISTSAATANSAAEFRTPITQVWRGNVPGLGGWFHRTRFTIGSIVETQQMFIGFIPQATAIATTQVPSALTNMFGVGFDAIDATLQIMTNDASGEATKISLGIMFPSNDPTAMFDFTCFAIGNGDRIGYTVQNLKTNDRVDGEVTADLVAETTFLAYHAYMNNGGTAASVVLGIYRVYTETDY